MGRFRWRSMYQACMVKRSRICRVDCIPPNLLLNCVPLLLWRSVNHGRMFIMMCYSMSQDWRLFHLCLNRTEHLVHAGDVYRKREKLPDSSDVSGCAKMRVRTHEKTSMHMDVFVNFCIQTSCLLY